MQTDIEEVSRDGAAVEVKEPERLEYAVGFRKQVNLMGKDILTKQMNDLKIGSNCTFNHVRLPCRIIAWHVLYKSTLD